MFLCEEARHLTGLSCCCKNKCQFSLQSFQSAVISCGCLGSLKSLYVPTQCHDISSIDSCSPTRFPPFFRATQNDFKSNGFLLVVCFVPATRLFVRSGLGRPEAVGFIKTCSYSISSHDYCFYFKSYNVGLFVAVSEENKWGSESQNTEICIFSNLLFFSK